MLAGHADPRLVQVDVVLVPSREAATGEASGVHLRETCTEQVGAEGGRANVRALDPDVHHERTGVVDHQVRVLVRGLAEWPRGAAVGLQVAKRLGTVQHGRRADELVVAARAVDQTLVRHDGGVPSHAATLNAGDAAAGLRARGRGRRGGRARGRGHRGGGHRDGGHRGGGGVGRRVAATVAGAHQQTSDKEPVEAGDFGILHDGLRPDVHSVLGFTRPLVVLHVEAGEVVVQALEC
mmetsp:Transcript_33433/g.85459  ORF Transcript_33433/g.85459 Transcript_33433/m.85459 type:complete len:237 (+) Transcript_33433:937-1647(+)